MKVKGIKIIVLSAITFCACHINKGEKENSKQFVLYDAIQFENKPNLEDKGLNPIILLYENKLTKADPNDLEKVILDATKVVEQAKQAAKTPEVPVSTDVEQWFSDASISQDEMVTRFKLLFDLFRRDNANLKIGNYGIAPSNLNVFRFYDKGRTPNEQLIEKWREQNKKVYPLLKYTDIIFPPVYIPEPDIQSWKKDFITTINEIKLHDDQKPVIVYLWPLYYDAPWSEYNRVIMEPGIWKEMLEVAYEYADGAVIWASKFDKNKKPISWTDPKVQEIWRVTKEFIQEKNL